MRTSKLFEGFIENNTYLPNMMARFMGILERSYRYNLSASSRFENDILHWSYQNSALRKLLAFSMDNSHSTKFLKVGESCKKCSQCVHLDSIFCIYLTFFNTRSSGIFCTSKLLLTSLSHGHTHTH